MIKATLRKGPSTSATSTPAAQSEQKTAPANDATGGKDFAQEFAGELDPEGKPATGTVVDGKPAEPGTAVTIQDQGDEQRPAHVPSMGENGAVAGEFDEKDIKLPTLKIVNGSGELSKLFNGGTLLLGDDVLFDTPDIRDKSKNPVMRFIPLRLQKRWRESLSKEEQEAQLMPRVVDTVREAEALSGRGCTEWENNQKPRWSPTAVVAMLIEQPTADVPGQNLPAFSEEIGGTFWSLAVFYVGGTAYGTFAKGLYNGMQFSCRVKGQIVAHRYIWEMSVIKKPAGDYTVFVPVPKLTREASPEAVSEYAARVNQDPRAAQATGE